MSDTDTTSQQPQASDSGSEASSAFSAQATGLVETTFAETLGLSMHNAVTNQQSSQMTTSASITNACARLLQAPVPRVSKAKSEEPAAEAAPEEPTIEQDTAKKRMNIKKFFKRDDTKEEPEVSDDNTSGQ